MVEVENERKACQLRFREDLIALDSHHVWFDDELRNATRGRHERLSVGRRGVRARRRRLHSSPLGSWLGNITRARRNYWHHKAAGTEPRRCNSCVRRRCIGRGAFCRIVRPHPAHAGDGGHSGGASCDRSRRIRRHLLLLAWKAIGREGRLRWLGSCDAPHDPLASSLMAA